MVGELRRLNAEHRPSWSHSLKRWPHETGQTLSFVLLKLRALGYVAQRHLASLTELEFTRAYDIWVMLILLI